MAPPILWSVWICSLKNGNCNHKSNKLMSTRISCPGQNDKWIKTFVGWWPRLSSLSIGILSKHIIQKVKHKWIRRYSFLRWRRRKGEGKCVGHCYWCVWICVCLHLMLNFGSTESSTYFALQKAHPLCKLSWDTLQTSIMSQLQRL